MFTFAISFCMNDELICFKIIEFKITLSFCIENASRFDRHFVFCENLFIFEFHVTSHDIFNIMFISIINLQ